ncbi:hypothetical protein [Gilvimarinus xylanilyticus]|uniref:Uncharacterized protein n=1 Tax=Gilvimarinus xylanilyticus TaxID=2944139 RepID=A0A9X2I5Y5_9GAMM|nr:hypothetical protein [Gilvimarinus xylanilyticus]MCP8899492.1 hypothetical protein [Gilvimarinus xylanilyticus]
MKSFNFGLVVVLSGVLGACGGSSGDDNQTTSSASSVTSSSSSSSSSISSSSSSLASSSSSEVSSSESSSSSIVSSSSSSSEQSSEASSSSEVSLLTGIFVDSAVANLDYQTPSVSGQTTAIGEFEYVDGELVSFSIGDLQLPAVSGGSVITPLDLVGTADPRDGQVLNIVRLLLTLDKDGNPDNGIELADAAKAVATPVDFSLSAEEFSSSAAVVNLITNAGQDSTVDALVTSEQAEAHFAQTLEDQGAESYLLQGTETIIVFEEETEPNHYSVLGTLTLESDGSCYLSAGEGYRSECTYAEDGTLETGFPTVVGTVGENSVTIIAKPNTSGSESVSALFHSAESASGNVSAGAYTISGQELIAQNNGNKNGPSVTALAGSFTVNTDGSCSINHNEGDISCELKGSEVLGTGDAAGFVMGTVSESAVTIVYHAPGDELVYGYLTGTR